MYHLSAQAVEEQRYKDAIKLLTRAIKINGAVYQFHYALARALLLAGDNKAAQRSLDRAIQLAPPDGKLDAISLADLEYKRDP